MSQADLLTPTSNKPRSVARIRKPSHALLERAVQGAANDTELNQKLGKKARKTAKENRPATADERRLESRAQITFESVPPRKTLALPKPRAPAGLGAFLRQGTKALAVPATPAPVTPSAAPGPAPPGNVGTAATAINGVTRTGSASGQKRPGSPSIEQPPARQRRGTGEPKPRPREGDLSLTEKRFVGRAYRAVRSLESIDPFTAKEGNDTKVNNAIVYARRAEPDDKDLPVTEAMRQLIGQRFHQLHGDVKSAAQSIFAPHYRFISSSNGSIIAKNKTIAKRLLTGDGFVYKNTTTRDGMYQHPCISDCINAVWFSSRDKEGPRFPKVFNNNNEGIKLETIALVLTALYNCAKEWSTGSFQMIQFRQTMFRSDYIDLLKRLQEYAKANPVLVGKLRCKFYRSGMAHAGVTIDTTTRSGLTDADIARAVAMDTISDDSEDGGDADDDEEDGVDAEQADGLPHAADDAALDILPASQAVEEPAVEEPVHADDEEDKGPRRAKGKAKALVAEDEEVPIHPEDTEDVSEVAELEQQLYAAMTADEQKAYLKMAYEERDAYLELSPADREIFLAMSADEGAEWMNDGDADSDGDGATGTASSSRSQGAVVFDPDGEDEMSTSSEPE